MSKIQCPKVIAKQLPLLSCVFVAILLTVSLEVSPTHGNNLFVIAVAGTESPINGELFSLSTQSPPSINDGGTLGFRSAGTTRIYKGRTTGVELVARGSTSGGNGSLGELFDNGSKRVAGANSLIAINDSSQIAVNLEWNPPDNVNIDRDAMILFDGPNLHLAAYDGMSLPEGGSTGLRPEYWPTLNDLGQMAFTSILSSATDGAETALYRWEPSTGGLTELVREGDTVPGGSGTFIGHIGNFNVFPSPVINNAGEAAFVGKISGSGVFDDQGIYMADGLTVQQIVRTNDQSPDFLNTSRRFREFGFWRPSMNDSGEVAFIARLTGGVQIDGVYKAANGIITRIAEVGFSFPGLDGFFRRRMDGVEINNPGDVVFHNEVLVTSDNTFRGGIFLHGANANDTRIIALGGLPTPGGLGEFYRTGAASLTANYALNDNGQVAFLTLVDTLPDASGGVIEGLFLDNPDSSNEVIAYEGMEFLGSSIVDLSFAGTSSTGGDWTDEYQGLNNRGEVAFAFELADGRDGIALWSAEVPIDSDFDSDGDVDGADFLRWQRTDGTIEGLAAWQESYGSTLMSSIAIPEPSCMYIVLVMSMVIWSSRYQHKN